MYMYLLSSRHKDLQSVVKHQQWLLNQDRHCNLKVASAVLERYGLLGPLEEVETVSWEGGLVPNFLRSVL